MLTGDRAKYLGLIFAIAFATFLLENQTSIFSGILKRTESQIADVTDAEIWVMDRKTEYPEQTESLKDTNLTRLRIQWAVKLYKDNPVARTLNGKFAVSFILGENCRQVHNAMRLSNSQVLKPVSGGGCSREMVGLKTKKTKQY